MKIEKVEFESIVHAVKTCERFPENKLCYLDSPYWKLDESCEPNVYMLQPISKLPGCEASLLSDDDQIQASHDAVFKVERDKKKRAASNLFWGIFESIQEMLKDGSKVLPEADREKYVISVTHDEVNRGLLYNDKRNEQAIYFERTIEDIDAAMHTDDKIDNALAGLYKDSILENNDPQGKRIPDKITNDRLEEMQRRCNALMDPSRVFKHSIPWVPKGALSKSNHDPPEQWHNYLDSFGTELITSICDSLFSKYSKPVTDPLEVELVSQNNSVLAKMENVGFLRDDVLTQLHEYVNGTTPVSDGDLTAKAFVLHGQSGLDWNNFVMKIICICT